MKNDLQQNLVLRSWDRLPVIDRGEGIYLWDSEGKQYIDGAAGSSVVANIGHGVGEVVEAMAEQGRRVSLAAPHAFVSEPVLELGRIIAEKAPGVLKNNCRSWFAVTGTDSTDDSARLARQYFVTIGKSSKYVVISRWQSFHGNNIAVAGFSGHTLRRKYYYPMFVNSPHIPPAYCYRCPYEMTYPGCNVKCARALETMIRQTGEENVAAFIAEPVVGAALGSVPAPPEYFKVVREICDRYDVLLIVDEVMTAWGRLGRWFGIEDWEITPDIIACAKGLTSGYAPLSATIAQQRLWEPIRESGTVFLAGHTMNHNPVAAAAAVANIRYIENNRLLENARETGEYLLTRMQELLESRIVGDVRGRGLMCGFELVKDKGSKVPFPPAVKASQAVRFEAQNRGLLLFPCTGCVDGVEGDMILITPPLIITKDEVDTLIRITKEALFSAEKQLLA